MAALTGKQVAAGALGVGTLSRLMMPGLLPGDASTPGLTTVFVGD